MKQDKRQQLCLIISWAMVAAYVLIIFVALIYEPKYAAYCFGLTPLWFGVSAVLHTISTLSWEKEDPPEDYSTGFPIYTEDDDER